MTRFARAKGSKSSNERKPEEATPWAEMKKSMLLKKSTKPEKFESVEEVKTDTVENTEWASLGDDACNSTALLKKNLVKKTNDSDRSGNINISNLEIKKKKKIILDNLKDEINSVKEDRLKFNKKHNQKFSVLGEGHEDKNDGNLKKKRKKRKFSELEGNAEVFLSEKKKKLPKVVKMTSDEKEKKVCNIKNSEIKNDKKFKKMKKNMESDNLTKKVKENFKFKGSDKKKFNGKINNQLNLKKKIKNKNFKKGNSGAEELIINGEKIPIVKYQGFYVTLEDAERLKKLRNEMIKEGIPKAKLEAAIKLERRRAEKALSRLKKSVCFHCRGRGHLLSNCPQLTENENTSTGICYKCGSTEHSAAECKVIKESNYKFAECFICKEQGHIARQCPDNPRGLYPQGGGCRECGDVTHLRKDCPKVIAQKAEEVVTVGLRSDRNLECLDEEIATRTKQNVKKKVKKIKL